MGAATPNTYVPTHPGSFLVEFVPGEYRSSLKSLKSFQAGETLALLTGISKGVKAYSSVQCGNGPNDHIELNSDLLYVNHSCEPNVAFDLSASDRAKWHLKALKKIDAGDHLTFFYPSTEWEMSQPFTCECRAPTCLGTIQGAKYLSLQDLLARGYVSPWIIEAKQSQSG
ncbi:Histone-lysine N-methyltransferase ash1 [Psilocybe cubensis]|uniref:SET domain-containing protein n=2 Tax=Psilocybe cubensis TaxID=181762 RepID=A0A8H8CIF1_PSICU|nr:Histone-lysine N-methyltransferase ash1 [Psilocybe cubensis]KAH9479641.1 Histone-lysine N-methyltransferase ash1 [Psilocybe cubensis]